MSVFLGDEDPSRKYGYKPFGSNPIDVIPLPPEETKDSETLAFHPWSREKSVEQCQRARNRDVADAWVYGGKHTRNPLQASLKKTHKVMDDYHKCLDKIVEFHSKGPRAHHAKVDFEELDKRRSTLLEYLNQQDNSLEVVKSVSEKIKCEPESSEFRAVCQSRCLEILQSHYNLLGADVRKFSLSLNEPEERAAFEELEQELANQQAQMLTLESLEEVEQAIAVGVSRLEELVNSKYDRILSKSEALCEKMTELNSTLLEKWSTVSIEGFESDPQVVSAYNHLEELKSRGCLDKEIQEAAIELKNAKASAVLKQESFDRSCNQMQLGVSLAAKVFSLTGDHEGARRFALLATTTIGIGKHIAGLAGIGSLASQGPLGVAIGLGSLVNNLVRGFASGGSEDATCKMLTQIQEQIQTVREEMHKRFSSLDSKIDLLFSESQAALSSLATLERGQAYTHSTLLALTERFDRFDQEVQSRLLDIAANLQGLSHGLQDAKRAAEFADLKGAIYTVLAREEQTPSQFISSIEDFELKALHEAIQPDLSAKTLPISSSPEDYEASVSCIYQILGSQQGMSIPNPTMYALASLAMLYVIISQYPKAASNDIRGRIAERDIERLRRLETLGIAYQEAVQELRQLTHQPLVDAFINSFRDAVGGIERHVKEIEAREANKSLANGVAAQLRAYDTPSAKLAFKRAFTNTVRPTKAVHNWFAPVDQTTFFREPIGSADAYALHRCGSDNPSHDPMGWFTRARVRDLKRAYSENIQRGVTRFKDAYLRLRAERAGSYGGLELPWFIQPIDPSMPWLPVPENILSRISRPEQVREAVSKGLGHIEMSYEIVSYSSDKFHLRQYFVSSGNASKEMMHELVLDYDSGIYEGPEAVWWFWVGGEHPGTLHASKHEHDRGCDCGSSFSSSSVTCVAVPELRSIPGVWERAINRGSYQSFSSSVSTILANDKKACETRALEEVKRFIDSDRRVKSLDDSYAQLAGYLSFAFHDEARGRAGSVAKFFNDPNASLNSEQFKKMLEKKGLASFLWGLSRAESAVRTIRPRSLAIGEGSSLIDATLETIKAVKEHYEPHAVRYNRVYQAPTTEVVKDRGLQLTASAIAKILNLSRLSDTVSSVAIQQVAQETLSSLSEVTRDLTPEEQEDARHAISQLLGKSLSQLTIEPSDRAL